MKTNKDKSSLRKMIITGVAGVVIASGLTGLIGCKDEKGKESDTQTVKVSDYGTFLQDNRCGVRYNGMNDKEHFSLSGRYYSATNVYYPKDAKNIHFENASYEIVSVDPNQITLRLIENK